VNSNFASNVRRDGLLPAPLHDNYRRKHLERNAQAKRKHAHPSAARSWSQRDVPVLQTRTRLPNRRCCRAQGARLYVTFCAYYTTKRRARC